MARRKRTGAQPKNRPTAAEAEVQTPAPARPLLSPPARKVFLVVMIGLETLWLFFLLWMALWG